MSNHTGANVLARMLSHIPSPIFEGLVTHAFAYGSSILPQSLSKQQLTLDTIIVVKNTSQFHSEMIKLRPSDYTGWGVKAMGLSWIHTMGHIFPIHFNRIVVNGVKVKYGVVAEDVLRRDLSDWNLIAMAGRLHKPVLNYYSKYRIINELNHQSQSQSKNYKPKQSNTQRLTKTNQNCLSSLMSLNLDYAFNTALLLLPCNTPMPMKAIYQQICHLSYMGDIRFSLPIEKQSKIGAIVGGGIKALEKLYEKRIKRVFGLDSTDKGGVTKEGNIVITLQQQQRIIQEGVLPQLIREAICTIATGKNIQFGKHNQTGNQTSNHYNYSKKISQKLLIPSNKRLIHRIGESKEDPTVLATPLSVILTDRIRRQNRSSSIRMAIQNGLGGGFESNGAYLLEKIGKRWRQ